MKVEYTLNAAPVMAILEAKVREACATRVPINPSPTAPDSARPPRS